MGAEGEVFFTSVDLWDEFFGGLVGRMTTVDFEYSFESGGEVFSPVLICGMKLRQVGSKDNSSKF